MYLLLILTKIHCTHFISMDLANMSSLQMCPVLDAVSLMYFINFLKLTCGNNRSADCCWHCFSWIKMCFPVRGAISQGHAVK